MTRTSQLIDFFPPMRSKRFSCNTLSSATCALSGRLLTSSRNSVPLSARSNLPSWHVLASVNAPASWPNNSLSTNSCGMLPQLTAMNSPSLRGLMAWMERAIISLPTPVSPVIKTGTRVGATISTLFSTDIMASLCAIKPGGSLMVSVTAGGLSLIHRLCKRSSIRFCNSDGARTSAITLMPSLKYSSPMTSSQVCGLR